MRHPFGWDYPPGAEHDPNAPYNQKEEVIKMSKIGTGPYSTEITIIQKREKTFEVAYENEPAEAYELIQQRIDNGELDMDEDSTEFVTEIFF